MLFRSTNFKLGGFRNDETEGKIVANNEGISTVKYTKRLFCDKIKKKSLLPTVGLKRGDHSCSLVF